MAEKKDELKIQPADTADTPADGQTPQKGATEPVPEFSVDTLAGKTPGELADWYMGVKDMQASATQKSQEAAEIRKQNEQLKAEVEFNKGEASKRQEMIDKYSDYFTRQQEPDKSTPSQPIEYDSYNPDKSFVASQKYWQDLRVQDRKEMDELKKTIESVKEESNVGLRTMKMERYLEKARPEMGPDVSDEEVVLWHNINRVDNPSFETINQALRERQTMYNEKAKKIAEKYIADKEKAAKGAQEPPGAAFASDVPDGDEFAKKTPAERDAIVAEGMNKFFKGGG